MASSATVVPIPQQAYFANQPGILSEWQFDYEGYINKHSKFGCMDAFFKGWTICDLIMPCEAVFCCIQQAGGILPIYRVFEYFLRSKPNLIDRVNAIHVGLTDTGVNYIVEKHLHRHLCSEEVIPRSDYFYTYAEITDVIVTPPYANCCHEEPLWTAQVTAVNKKPMYISGLKHAENFKSEVLRIKASKGGFVVGQPGQPQVMMAPQPGQQVVYQQQPGQPQVYQQQQQPGQPQPQMMMMAPQPGQQIVYQQQPGQPGQPPQQMMMMVPQQQQQQQMVGQPLQQQQVMYQQLPQQAGQPPLQVMQVESGNTSGKPI